ncbi:MAG: SUMF1/EgtB/PvdO family nonheme iron enzyme [Hyphomonadaceae bacterium]
MSDVEKEDRQIRLASIVAVDMAGFSTMSERDQRRAARNVEALRARIEAIATANQGRIFNTAGDGFMLEFGSAGSALSAIQDLLDQRPKGEPDIRIGAHVGDVVVTVNNDLLGHGVNVAARLQALATPNTALVSNEFRSMSRNSPSAVFMARGRQPLENIDQRVQTFAILSQRARSKRFWQRVMAAGGATAAVGAIAAAMVFLMPPALDFLQKQEFLRPQAAAEQQQRAMADVPATETVEQAPPQQQAEATPRGPQPGDVIQDCERCPEMVVLAAGAYMMGSPAGEAGSYDTERPQREIRIAAFAVSKTEITYEQFDACASAGACGGFFPPERGGGRGKRPVVGVSWRDAQAYITWLNSMTNGPAYRLLSEAEWEYAARAGTTTRYSFGDSITREQAVFRSRTTDPVGTYAANAFGLYDMQGNAAEWVEDCYNPTYAGLPTHGGPVTSGQCNFRLYRGGAYSDQASVLRVANRRRAALNVRDGTIGIRVARELE